MELMDCQNWAVVVRDWLLLATVFTKAAFHCLKTVTVSAFIDVDDEDIAAEMAKIPFGRLKLHDDFSPTLHHNDESLQIECKKSILITIIMRVPLELTRDICDILAEEDAIWTMKSFALICSQLTRRADASAPKTYRAHHDPNVFFRCRCALNPVEVYKSLHFQATVQRN